MVSDKIDFLWFPNVSNFFSENLNSKKRGFNEKELFLELMKNDNHWIKIVSKTNDSRFE